MAVVARLRSTVNSPGARPQTLRRSASGWFSALKQAPKPWGSGVRIQSHFFGSLARFGWISVSILGRNSSGMKKQRCSGFRRLIVATQGAGSAWTAISRAFVVVSAATRRTIASLHSAQQGSGPCRLRLRGPVADRHVYFFVGATLCGCPLLDGHTGPSLPNPPGRPPPPLRLRRHRRHPPERVTRNSYNSSHPFFN